MGGMMSTVSISSGATGLMAFWAEIDPAYLIRYQQWHNCEHIPERVRIPGFLRGRRYRNIDGLSYFLMFYETHNVEVLESDSYFAALNRPTPWTSEALKHFRQPARNIYQLQAEVGVPSVNPAPYLVTIRFNDPDETNPSPDEQANWLQRLCDESGAFRSRLYSVNERITQIKSSERKIYGDGPGAQKYLAMLEFEAPVQASWFSELQERRMEATKGLANTIADSFFIEFGFNAEK
jgi:hypothetical protein